MDTYADSHKEFVEVDVTVAVCVEEGHQGVGLFTGDTDLDFAKAGVELLLVNLVVSVEGIEVPESSAETTDCLSTSGVDLSPNPLED